MTCPACDGTGWKALERDGVRRVERCDCWREQVTARLFTDARIPRRYQHCDLDWADTFISMGCGVEDSCPVLYLPKFEDWGIEDPYGGTIEDYRRARDVEIEGRVLALIDSITK